jgi:hypothetical protein
MEAVAAVGLATNAIQLVEVTRNIVSTAREIGKSARGLSKEAEQFRQHAACVVETAGPYHPGKRRFKIQPHHSRLRGDFVEARQRVPDGIGYPGDEWIELPVQAMESGDKGAVKKEQMEESMKSIQRMGDQITMHIITGHLPYIDTRLDDLHAQTYKLSH